MKGKVYIASPFFDDWSREWVTTKENDFKGIGYNYFSPREDGLSFSELKGKLRSDRIKLIFYNNYRQLMECDHICCNLMPCKGTIDIGTLWELGAFIGLHGLPDFKDSKDPINQIYVQRELESDILQFCKELDSLTITDIKKLYDTETKYLIGEYTSYSPVPKILSDCIQQGKLDQVSNPMYIVTDDFPWRRIMYMGFLYSKGISYITVSFKNYGSNVMIAASSEGHLSLPGVVDDTYRTSIL